MAASARRAPFARERVAAGANGSADASAAGVPSEATVDLRRSVQKTRCVGHRDVVSQVAGMVVGVEAGRIAKVVPRKGRVVYTGDVRRTSTRVLAPTERAWDATQHAPLLGHPAAGAHGGR